MVPDLNARTRRATTVERRALLSLLARSGRAVPLERPLVVLAYPGVGVGEQHRELAGCTDQLAVIAATRPQLAAVDVDVVAISTRPPDAPDPALRGALLTVDPTTAQDLPHVDLDGERYLTRATTLLGPRLGGALDGLVLDEIADAATHTRALVGLVVASRRRVLEQDRRREPQQAAAPDHDHHGRRGLHRERWHTVDGPGPLDDDRPDRRTHPS